MLRQVLWKALWATPIVLAVDETLVSVQVVRGHSMSPTLHDGDVLLINKFATLCLRPVLCLSYPLRVARGDVVTLWCVPHPTPFSSTNSNTRSPYDPNMMLTKRIIAMQGDWLHVPRRTDFVRLKRVRSYFHQTCSHCVYQPCVLTGPGVAGRGRTGPRDYQRGQHSVGPGTHGVNTGQSGGSGVATAPHGLGGASCSTCSCGQNERREFGRRMMLLFIIQQIDDN